MKTNHVDLKNFKRIKSLAKQDLFLENWYYENFLPDFGMDFHCHPQIEIMYCENGGFDFIHKPDAQDDACYSVTVPKNCFIIVNTGFFHKLANILPETKIINLEFLPAAESKENPAAFSRAFSLSFEKLYDCCSPLKDLVSSDKNYYVFLDERNVSATMKEIIKKATEPDCAERTVYLSLLTNKLFLDIAHCLQLEQHKKTGFLYVDMAMIYINSRFFGSINVSDVAKSANISAVYLQKLFKKKFNKTVYEIITEKRVIQAKYLISQTNLSLGDVAKQCGFKSREQLIYNFRKTEKCTPAEYKKKNAGKTVRNFSDYGEFTLYADI